MPTTSGTLAAELLDALTSTGVEFAVLHGEVGAAEGVVTSDIDVAVGSDTFTTVRALIAPARAVGLAPVLVWPYDIASTSTFWATSDAGEGVHLDLTCDPHGRGRYGFRTSAMLARSHDGIRWPVLHDLDEALYLLRKRQVKGDATRCARALEDVRSRFGAEEAERRVETLFSPAAARSLRRFLLDGTMRRDRGRAAHLLRSSKRAAWRLAHPIGFWAEVESAAAPPVDAAAVAQRFRRFLVGATGISPRVDTWAARALLWRPYTRCCWRPQLLVTTVTARAGARRPRPDSTVRVAHPDLDVVCVQIVDAMRERATDLICAGGHFQQSRGPRAAVQPSCVLTFHRVVERPERVHDIGWTDFNRLVSGMDRASVGTRLAPDHEESPPSIVLTFDDGTSDHLAVAEALERRGLEAVFFISSALLGTPGYLSHSEVLAIRKMGHVVGSHAVHHGSLLELSADGLDRELHESRRALEDVLGEPIKLFAPPGGIFSPAVLRAVQHHGYEACRTMQWGLYGSPEQRWMIPCVPVTSFTLARGWVDACVQQRRVPLGMRAMGTVKSIAPTRLRALSRAWLHRPPARGDL